MLLKLKKNSKLVPNEMKTWCVSKLVVKLKIKSINKNEFLFVAYVFGDHYVNTNLVHSNR